MPDYLSSDYVVLSELALLGEFVRIPSTRFYRRMDAASATLLQDEQTVIHHHYPTTSARQLFQSWRLQLGYCTAFWRHELSLRTRWRALRFLGHQIYWRRKDLAADVAEAIGYLLSYREKPRSNPAGTPRS